VDPLDPGPPADPIAPLREALRGHYDIIREIGQGAFATVYLAQDHKHERKVALKVLHADPTSETGELRFIREIRLLARLQHPNILPLHDSGHVQALLYYVMPYVAGETLRDRINRERHIDIASACSITREVADALAYAHGQGVIHRDIKPENILLSAGHPILADFGIARAIDLAGVRQLTQTGMGSPGTPAYMSPEQLMGDREIDGRSDTYSLGCVLFEMLTGTPPFSGKEGFVRRFTEPPPIVSPLRRDAPRWIDDVITTALARDQNDRYQTAHEFASALVRSMTASGERVVRKRIENELAALAPSPSAIPVPSATQFRAPINVRNAIAEEARLREQRTPSARLFAMVRSHPAVFAGSAVAIALLAGVVATDATTGLRNAIFTTPLDSARIAIVPFSGLDGSGRDFATNLYDELSSWKELPLVSDTKVAETVKMRGTPRTEAEAVSIARTLGAGKLVWGAVNKDSAETRIRVRLYDVASGERSDDFAADATARESPSYRGIATRVLAGPNRPPAASSCDSGTRSFNAWSACGRGHVALKNWNVGQAEREFAVALAADPEYAPVSLWLAQIESWRDGANTSVWKDNATRAASFPALSARDRLLADALVAMSNREYPTACHKYRALTRADSLDYVGWYGLGECQALDSVVVPSSRSPSGWDFRSSNGAAATAYRHALKLAPGARAVFSFARLQSLLPTAATKVRMGRSFPPNAISFMASPSLGSGDTLGFVPYPAPEFGNKPAAASSTLSAAIARNADDLLDFTVDWTRNAQNDPSAFEALADMLEVHGNIGDDPSPTGSALSALRKAAGLSADAHQLLRIKSSEAWLRFKRSEFADARRVADELVLANPRPSRADAASLVALAALTGRVELLARLADITGAAIPDGVGGVPLQVRTTSSRYFSRAAMGICGDPIAESRKDLDDAIDRYVAPSAAPAMAQAVLSRPLSMLAPCTRAKSVLEIKVGRDRTTRMQQAFARGDKTAFRAIKDSIEVRIRTRRPGDLSPDFIFQQAWLRAATGDTAAAIAQLDRSLRALPGLSPPALREAGSAAALVRAMLLRADLAAATRDTANAAKWANTVSVLWSAADPLLAADLQRMRGLANHN
jgi:serine/threonine protein kinase